jgi:hypothetical protein
MQATADMHLRGRIRIRIEDVAALPDRGDDLFAGEIAWLSKQLHAGDVVVSGAGRSLQMDSGDGVRSHVGLLPLVD